MSDGKKQGAYEGRHAAPSNKKKKKYKIHWLRIFLAVILVCVIVGCGMVAGVFFSVSRELPDLDSADLDTYAVTTVILDKDGVQVGDLHTDENRVPVEYDEISPNAVNALIAIEDQRFRSHNGVDPIRIAGAFVANLRAGTIVQGGSTITQQLVRLTFLGPDDKGYERKIKEAILAVKLEKQCSKDEILTHYLNRAYFGGGAYGIEAAAEYFFAKHANELSVPEAAMLAGCIQNPSRWSPIQFPDNALTRRNLVLDQMADCDFITEEEAEQYKAMPIELSEVRVTAKESEGTLLYQSFIDHVIEEALEVLDLSEEDAKQLYTGGYTIYSTMDQTVQKQIEDVYSNDGNFPNANVQSAMIVTDPETGAIRGVVGGRHQKNARELNRATQAFRQPGSSFKPIAVYAPAFEAGYGPGTVVDDYPKDYNGHVFKNSNRTYSGLTTIRKGIVSSLNVVAVKTMDMTGIDKCYNFIKQMDFSKLTDSDRNLSTALGGVTVGVSPLEMAGAYGAFANGGVYIKPYAITKITDQKGKTVWELDVEKKVIMSEQSAYLLTSCLRDAASSGTGSAANIRGHQTAGKTGTTSDNKDAWFAGYTRQYVGVVWVGYDTPKKLGSNAFGGTVCAPIFNKVLTPLHQNLPAENFVQPSGIVSVSIDTKSGLRPSALTPSQYISSELFNSKNVPRGTSDVWQEVDVCPVSGQRMTASCPGPAQKKVALVRKEAWVPIEGLVPADANLEIRSECTVHTGQPAAGAVSMHLSGRGDYNNANNTLRAAQLQWTPATRTLEDGTTAPAENVLYVIHRATSLDFRDDDTLDATQSTSYTDSAPVSGATNYYRIVATDAGTSEQLGVSDVMSFAYQVTPEQAQGNPSAPPASEQPSAPSEPANSESAQQPQQAGSLTLSGSSDGSSVVLTWNAPGSGDYQYYVFRDGVQIGKDTVITGTGFIDSSAEAGQSYTYMLICADRGSGREVARSGSVTVQN